MAHTEEQLANQQPLGPFTKAGDFAEDFGKSPSGRLLKKFDTLIAVNMRGPHEMLKRAVKCFREDNLNALTEYAASQPLYPFALMYMGVILNDEALFNDGLQAGLEKDSVWGFYDDGDIKQQKMMRERWIRRSGTESQVSFQIKPDQEYDLLVRSFTIGQDTKAAFLIKKFARKNPSYIEDATIILSRARPQCDDVTNALRELRNLSDDFPTPLRRRHRFPE